MTLNIEHKTMVSLLNLIPDERIKLVIVEQITTLENIFTLKIQTQVTQRKHSMSKTQIANIDWIYDHFQQDNVNLQI